MKNNIDLEDQLIILTTKTIVKLFDYKNGADLVALYLFYHKQCKLQKTNQSFTLKDFAKKGLHWGDNKFKTAKRVLKELDLIEDIVDRDEKGIIKGWYIRLKYISSLNNAILSSGAENHPLDEPTDGSQETNALSIKLKMLKVNNINAGSELLVDFNLKDPYTNNELLAYSNNKDVQIKSNKLLVDSNNKDVPVKSNELVNEINTPPKKPNKLDGVDMEQQFEGFWKLYPRSEGKKTAKDSFLKKMKSTEDLFLLAFGLKKWLEEEKKKGTDPKYYPHCTTWLNQERFRDYEEQYSNKTKQIETKSITLEDKDNVDWL